MDIDKIERFVRLSRMPGIGVICQNRLIKLCEGIEGCFTLPLDEMIYREKLIDKAYRIGTKRLEVFAEYRDSQGVTDDTKAILKTCQQKSINVVVKVSLEYPNRFKGIPDMPVVLYTRGILQINDYSRSAGVIGARRCSTEGKNTAISITEKEIQSGSAIISGMAKGIDSYAHTAAIKTGGYTIAVLGSGPDICYPMEHEKLYEEIADHGCVLSEYPPSTLPRSYMFPKRNRLIAALSDVVYVIDAGRHSGTETTSAYCRLYGKTVEYL